MLFGVKLQSEIYAPWKDYYINYDQLKKLLKESVVNNLDPQSAWSEKDEAAFAEFLDKELEKVYSFQVSKYKELDDEISKLELQSEKYLELLEQNKKDNSFDPNKFQQKLEELLSLANELDHFARLNFTGFIKIVKKHDRLHKGYSVKALLNVRMKDLPLNNISEDTSPYLFRISTLYSFIRDQISSVALGSSLSNSLQNSFSKLSSSGKLSTTPTLHTSSSFSESQFRVLKFWVHPDNLMEIKTTILRHLPVLIYNHNSNDDDDDDDENGSLSDSTITALYFDNRNFELYNNKLLKQLNKTPSLRIVWNGKLKTNSDLSIEKRIFDYDTGKSNDIKLTLKEKYMNDFIFPQDDSSNDNEDKPDFINDESLDDDNDINDYRKALDKKKKASKKLNLAKFQQRLKKKGFSKDKIDTYSSNFKTLQDFIVNNHLEPVLRTVYTRTAFQMPGDDRIRITIDSDILFIREDSFDQQRPIRNPHEWHRKDIDSSINNPYSLLRQGEYSKFPYSVMEIKISTSILNNPQSRTLTWVNELTNSHLVKEVPNFSKFIQGISAFFLEDDNLDILPFWLPELEWDIRKNPEQAYVDSKNKRLKELQQAEVLKNLKKKIGSSVQPQTASSNTHLQQITEEGDDLDVDSSDDDKTPTPSNNSQTNVSTSNNTTPTPVTSSTQYKQKLPLFPSQKKKKHNLKDALMPMFSSSKLDGYESEDEEIVLPPGVVKPTQLIRQSGPVRVEAKVWLANERTFVRWLHVTTLLTAWTFTIYSSVKSSHFPLLATNLAYIYFALSLFSGVWAYTIYMKRLELIKARSGTHLDGIFGPLVLAGILMITLGLEFFTGLKKWKEKAGVSSLTVLISDSLTTDQTENLHPLTKWALSKLFSLTS